jgi:hypothetical protein
MYVRHSLSQVVGEVADGEELCVSRLPASVEMRKLSDRPAAQDTDPQASIILRDHARRPG